MRVSEGEASYDSGALQRVFVGRGHGGSGRGRRGELAHGATTATWNDAALRCRWNCRAVRILRRPYFCPPESVRETHVDAPRTPARDAHADHCHCCQCDAFRFACAIKCSRSDWNALNVLLF